jgi:hypothetical protein
MTFDFVSGLLGGLHRPWWGNLEITHRDSMGRLAKVGRPNILKAQGSLTPLLGTTQKKSALISLGLMPKKSHRAF